jgi:hypothetical protein
MSLVKPRKRASERGFEFSGYELTDAVQQVGPSAPAGGADRESTAIDRLTSLVAFDEFEILGDGVDERRHVR